MYIYILLLFLIIIIIYFSLTTRETFMSGYDKWNLRIFNQNYDKPWKSKPVAYNNEYVSDIPRSSNNDKNFPSYILEIHKENKIKKILNKMISPNYPKQSLDETDITWQEYYRINQNTWYNRQNEFNIYDSKLYENDKMLFPTIQSCIPDVNKILTKFLLEFNDLYFKDEERGNRSNPFTLFKYRIHKIKQAVITENKKKGCLINYQIIVVLTKNDIHSAPTIYLSVLEKNLNKEKDIYFKEFDIIGYYKTDKLFTQAGYEKRFYQLNSLYRKGIDRNPVTWYDVENQWTNNRQYDLDNTLHYQYTCFNAQPQFYNPLPRKLWRDVTPILKFTYNKTNCESQYDNYGRLKPKGVWDRPCLDDNECIFYQANKNYPNKYGYCNKDTGFCQMPKGMKNLSFHHYTPYGPKVSKTLKEQNIVGAPEHRFKPLCYNCKSVNKSGKWLSMTKLDTCCEEQKDRKKYPYLKGPDYAFRNDFNERLNY